jgi:hypothetical protein
MVHNHPVPASGATKPEPARTTTPALFQSTLSSTTFSFVFAYSLALPKKADLPKK